MAIRIVRNEQGNCVNFVGSSNPAYWNACLSAEINAIDPTTINIKNDLQSDEVSDIYEFWKTPFTEFLDRDGNGFATIQDAVDYININANVVGLSGGGIDLTNTPTDFCLDPTTTSILLDNGYHYGVNSIQAVGDADGTVHITSVNGGDITHFHSLTHTDVTICGNAVAGGLNDVVNALNELFTVGAFTSGVVTDPYSTMVADVNGETTEYTLEGNAIDPSGADIAGAADQHNNRNGVKSSSTISRAGEYFSFDIRVEGTIGFGLVNATAEQTIGNATYGDPAGFCNGVVNSSHYGWQFAHYFHPTPNGPWTNYGANTSYRQGAGWYNNPLRFASSDEGSDWLAGSNVKMRVGINENAFIHIDYYDVSEASWVNCARTSYPVPEGNEYHLGIKFADTNVRLYTAPKIHLIEEDDAPTVIGDTGISLLGDATGTLAGGITTTTGNGNNDGVITTEALDAAGEYFEITLNNNEDHLIALFADDEYVVADVQTDADANAFLEQKYAFFGNKVNTNEQLTSSFLRYGSGTNIGVSTITRPSGVTHWRIGFDTQGRAAIWSSTNGTDFTLNRRMTSAAPSGDYKLYWRGASGGATLETVETGTLTSAPTMNFRYIESPDGSFYYPLFSSEEEANYYDLQEGGTGTSHSHIFPDDPTNTTWRMPDTGGTHAGSSAPSGGTFLGNPIQWTEITTLADADFAPTAYPDTIVNVNELAALSTTVAPADAPWTTTITNNDGSNFALVGMNVEGTAPEVTGDNITNPSDDYTVTITRTNSYGSSTGTLTVRVANLTAPSTAVTGWTWDNTSTPLVDSDTLASLSVIDLDDTVSDGRRLIIPKSWVQSYVLPALQESGDAVFIGVRSAAFDTTSVSAVTDFDFVFRWQYYSATAHKMGITANGVFNEVTINSMTDSFYDFAIEVDGTDVHMIACNVNAINTEPAVNDGGSFSIVYSDTGYTGTLPLQVMMMTLNTEADFSATGLSEIDIPATPSNATNWTKALDFSGSSQRALMSYSSASFQPLALNQGVTVTAPANSAFTTAYSTGRPWATAVVFSPDYNSSNQHIWNQGEGTGSTDDNIYLRLASDRRLYFGWGRSGALNELYLGTLNPNIDWYGCYIGFNGTRLSGANATAANLADCFDVRLIHSGNNFTMSTYEWSNSGTNTGWNSSFSSTGGRMDRTVLGDFTIGGRGANRSFHGKVASFVATTLRLNTAMPTNAEIEMMITDPMQWLQDYKVGNTFRVSNSSTNDTNFQLHNDATNRNENISTWVWLMGDGPSDSYSNMIRNQVNPSDQNFSKLNLISMVSNDIENVNINGLS